MQQPSQEPTHNPTFSIHCNPGLYFPPHTRHHSYSTQTLAISWHLWGLHLCLLLEGGNTHQSRGLVGEDQSVAQAMMMVTGLWARGSDLGLTHGTKAPCRQQWLIVAGPV